ncbi:TlpA family protein disulfide reductase [Prevotella sp. HCN-7019]|uniref:TlpA family protein disulfide reductase n=1 Tax=Prevotella sp. HCN-7019 TaxID=3134668 RepID=UPI0030BDA35A
MRIELDGWAKKPMTVTEGLNEKVARVAELLEQLYEDVFAIRARRGDRWQIVHDTVAASVRRKLADYALYLDKDVKGVDEDLRAKARQDIRMQLLLAFQNQVLANIPRVSEATKQEWLAQLDSMTVFCSINHPDSPFSLSFYDAASYDTGIRYYTKGEPKPEGVEKGVQLDFYDFTHRLTGKAQEAALAQLFLEDEFQQQYDPQLLPLADEFRRLYPESGWMPWVDRAVAKNRAFNETTIPADIHFPDVSSAKTIKDVTDRYKGKVIFMDIWATWCGPCRASFAHVGPLQEYAAANDVVLLYLSIDRPENDEKWRKMAAHYNLKGEHVRDQVAFHQEIFDTFGHNGALSIPRCIIFDKQGNIRFGTAAFPEQWERLKKQLQEAAQ